MNIKDYFSSLFKGVSSLLKGMEVTGKEFVTPKITERYPENRDTLKISDRFRGTLTLKYDAEGNHKCIACGICQMNCPNGTINLVTKMVELPDGKKKKKLDKYMYDLGSCTFCQLCTQSCPTNAIEFSNAFEHAVFTKDKLVHQLNYLSEKEEPIAPVAPKAAPEASQVASSEKKSEEKSATASQPAKDENVGDNENEKNKENI